MHDKKSNSEYSKETISAYTCRRTDLLSLIPIDAKKILEIGCSDGNLGTALKERVSHDVNVIGVEIDERLANIARNAIDYVFNENVETLDFDALRDFAPFDCIVLGDVLEHLTTPDVLLMRLSPLLKEDGHLVSSIPNIRHVSALWTVACNGTFPRRSRGIFDSTHLRWFTIGDAKVLFESAGYFIKDEVFNLRVWDKGGGIANRLLARLPARVAALTPIREFFTYQYSLNAQPAAGQDQFATTK